MSQQQPQIKILFLRAVTPLHVGIGRGSAEHVDVPIQRDEFGFPCIWASSLKGAVRGELRRYISSRGGSEGDKQCFRIALGPEPQEAAEGSSAIAFLDARLLFIPARSLKGVWTYLTSPHLLGYLNTYLELSGKQIPNLENIVSNLPKATTNKILIDDNITYINESEIKLNPTDEKERESITNALSNLLPKELAERIKDRGLVIVDDDTAQSLIRKSLIVQYRIRLSPETKTVVRGALWNEEYLPQETILVSATICRSQAQSKEGSTPCGDGDICSWLLKKFKDLNYYLWVGGKETLGRGIIKLYPWP